MARPGGPSPIDISVGGGGEEDIGDEEDQAPKDTSRQNPVVPIAIPNPEDTDPNEDDETDNTNENQHVNHKNPASFEKFDVGDVKQPRLRFDDPLENKSNDDDDQLESDEGVSKPPPNTNAETDETSSDSTLPDHKDASPPTSRHAPSTSAKWDKLAIALKTGSSVALTRLPVQLLTFLRPIRNLLLIGEGATHVGPHAVWDVLTGLYDNKEKPRDFNGPGPVRDRWKKEREEALKKMKPGEEALIPDKTNVGWLKDAHKNLPGFRLLWEKFPDAEWYIMIDDDTYILLSNLDAFLSQFDPNQPHYFGSANVFTGCDGVRKFGAGPPFAHGGSGIVISRGAMSLLTSGLDACISKYRDCWAGDVRTALCLRDQGVLLTRRPGFNGEAPNAKFRWPPNPCDRPLTFHHLLVKQVQQVFEVEQRVTASAAARGDGDAVDERDDQTPSVVTYADVFQVTAKEVGLGQHEPGTNRPGMDYQQVACRTAQRCEDICREDEKCMAWTLDEGRCWLKGGIPSRKEKRRAVSGVIVERYKCVNRPGVVREGLEEVNL
ncbi:hypothetical protein HK104_002934 [Borealophlyctis nickersoniae]|nr:hypothetical protein HK104_002934 [Borealophlyctis nickersoniae]